MMRNPLFRLLRYLLVKLTGTGADRSPTLNGLHHKLAFRLHKLLPLFGIKGIVTVPASPSLKLKMRSEDGGVAHQFIMYRHYEPFETSVVQERLMPGMTVWNIGANLGYYTLLASQKVGNAGRVIAIEPAPENLFLLNENIALNGAENVKVLPAAISDTVGEAQLFLSTSNAGDHQLGISSGNRTSATVEITTVDELVRQGTPEPHIIIMDVQGSELEVLRGATEILFDRSRSLTLIMEYWPEGVRKKGGSPEELIEILTKAGFTVSLIDEAKKQLRPIAIDSLLNITSGEVNLLCERQ